jgi:hypothetical protein
MRNFTFPTKKPLFLSRGLKLSTEIRYLSTRPKIAKYSFLGYFHGFLAVLCGWKKMEAQEADISLFGQ